MAKTVIYNSSSASTVFDTDNIAVDESTGNRYINDRDSSTIYRIDSGGTIITLLTGHQWNVIRFIGGYLYASKDLGGIYKITPTPGTSVTTSTLAATGSGSTPWGIAVDTSGNVYVYLIATHEVKKYAPGSSSGVTVAGGNGNGGAANQLSFARDIAVDSSGNIYIADEGNHRIQKFAAGSTGSTNGTTVAGGNGQGNAANQLYKPRGVTIDSSGNLYISDSFNHRVQKWASGASSGTTVAGGNGTGSGLNKTYYPYGIAVDSSGSLYIADSWNHRIVKWTSGASSGTIVAGGNGNGANANQLAYPYGIDIDSSANIYIAGRDNDRIQKWASGASSGTTVLGGNGAGSNSNQLREPTGVALDSSGVLYVADSDNDRIQKHGTTSNTILNQITSTSGTNGSATNQLGYPKGFHIFNNDECYVADGVQGRIMYWTSSASAGTQIASGLSSPMDVTVDSSGNLIVADQANYRVLKFTRTATNTFNQTPSVIAGGNGSGSALNQVSPLVIKSNSDGSLTVLEGYGSRVVKWASGASSATLMSSGYSSPTDLYVYSNGDLLISEVGSVASTTDQKITLDTGLSVAPTMAITSTISSGSTSGASAITMTFTSSLATSNFTVTDISVSGGSLSSFSSTSTTVYTATFTPSGDGAKSISVGANAYTDTAWGNNNTASNIFAYTVGSAPVTSSTSLTSNNALGATKAKVGDVVTLTFVTDININSPTVAFTSGGQGITNSVTVTGSNTNWTATYTVNSSDTEGAVAISITATSTSGIQASAHTTISSGSVTVDKTAPVWSSIYPFANASVNTTAVQYTLSEALSSGTLTWTQTGGSAASQQVVNLIGAELNAGSRASAVLTNPPTLVNGAIYSIAYNGIDLSGNASSTTTATNITFNNVLPTITSVTSTTTDGYYNAGDAINITVNFSGSVTLPAGGGGPAGGGATPTMVVTLETGSTDRTVSFTDFSGTSVSGTYTVQAGDTSADLAVKTIVVNDGNISNTAGNMTDFTVGSNLSTTSAIVIDTTAPVISNVSPASSSTVLNKNIGYTLSEQCASGTVVFTRTGGSSTDSGSPHTVNLVASELTSGVHVPADLFNNPTLVNGSVYSIAFNATDLAGNTATTVTNTSVTYNPDSVAPTLVITSNDVNSGDLSNLETIVLIFTISEVVTNFVVGNITVSGGALSGFTGSGQNYACTFTPSGDGVKTIDVAAGVFTDSSSNGNLPATQFSYTHDGTKPTVSITSSEVNHNGSYGGNQIGLTFTTSEATINFEEEDVVVSNGLLSNFTATSSTVYTATFTSTINGECNINVYSDVFTDAASNFNTGSLFTWTKTGVNPTILITSSIAKFGTTTLSSIPLTFTTSASTSNFVVGDIVVDGGGTISNFTGSGTSYTATFTPSRTGVQTITVPKDSFTNSDLAGNVEGQFIFTHARVQLSASTPGTVTNFVKRDVLQATVTTENGQSCILTDRNFYYENGVSSADVLPDGSTYDGIEMVGTQIDIELEMDDNTIPDSVEAVMIGSWSSMGH